MEMNTYKLMYVQYSVMAEEIEIDKADMEQMKLVMKIGTL